MPYILFNTHHWQRATSQKTRETALLHNLSGYTSNHSSVSEGQHATRLIHANRYETKSFVSVLAYFCNAVWTETVIPSDAHTMSLSCLQTTRLADSSLYKMDINHLVWFQSISVHFFFFLFFFEKTQWTKWIASLWEQAAGNCTCLSTMLQLFSGSVSLLFAFPFTRPPPAFWKQTFSDLQTHQSVPLHIKIPKLDKKTGSKILQKPRMWGLNFFFQLWKLKCKNILFPFPLLRISFQHVPFSFHFPSPTFICPFLQQHRPLVSFLSPAELNKSQHCKIHMMSSGNVDMWK